MPQHAPYRLEREGPETIRKRSKSGDHVPVKGGPSQFPFWDSTGTLVPHTLVATDVGSGAALTKTDDTNVTATLTGTPATALLAATNIALGWTGTLSAARGGTGGTGAWTAYTPTVVQSGTVTSFTSNSFRYVQIGKVVHVIGLLVINNAGGAAGANAVTVSLPVNSVGANLTHGTGFIFDSSLSLFYPGLAYLQSASTIGLLSTQSHVANVLGANDFVAALATGDYIDVNLTYEVA